MINQESIQEPQQRKTEPITSFRAMLFSSLCFFLAIAGMIGSGMVLQHATGGQALLVGGLIGLGSSTLIALACAASVFVTLISLVRLSLTRS